MATSKYKSQIDANYKAAAHYYTQRKKIFLSLYQQQYQTNFKEANQMFFDKFREKFDEFSAQVIQRCENRNNVTDNIVVPTLQFKEQVIDTGITNERLIGLQIGEVRRQLGFAYEHALQQYFDKIIEKSSDSVDAFIDIHTGDIVQDGFTFSHGASVRADFGFSTMSKEQAKKSMHFELSSSLAHQLAQENVVANPEAVVSALTANGYLDSTKFIGGFSVKNYSENIAYTHSKPLMNTVNQELLKLGPKASVEEGLDTILFFIQVCCCYYITYRCGFVY